MANANHAFIPALAHPVLLSTEHLHAPAQTLMSGCSYGQGNALVQNGLAAALLLVLPCFFLLKSWSFIWSHVCGSSCCVNYIDIYTYIYIHIYIYG